MTGCEGCGAPSASAVLCETCVARVLGGLTRIREARRRAGGGPPQPTRTASPGQLAIPQLVALEVVRYLELVPSVCLLGVHVWFWRYLFRVPCVQRAAPAVTHDNK